MDKFSIIQIVLMDVAKNLKLESYPTLNKIVESKGRTLLSNIEKKTVTDEFKNAVHWRLDQRNYGFFGVSFEYYGSDYGAINLEIYEGLNSLHKKNEVSKVELTALHLDIFITDLFEVNL